MIKVAKSCHQVTQTQKMRKKENFKSTLNLCGFFENSCKSVVSSPQI